ncbi:hypothetical protein [Priestia flexa]|jgi:hypothetical protein|uniref:hypothetical protein n=1 Tax=Priestia flexa TaxID=86664 RepID=UPI00099D05F1|nr:hypothetical protein [Priestia flexa]AQX56142.1 hypothetical protein BC359_18835 [Priestia flexa]
MNFVRVIKSSAIGILEDKINTTLENNKESELIDIKVSATYNGAAPVYIAVILFEEGITS